MRTYREIFFAYNGPGPWACYFCDEPVTPEDLDVHHKDENKKNNLHSNLTASHRTCHASQHSKGRKSPEHSQLMKDLWASGRYANKIYPMKDPSISIKVSIARKGVPNPSHGERIKKAWDEGKYGNRKPRS